MSLPVEQPWCPSEGLVDSGRGRVGALHDALKVGEVEVDDAAFGRLPWADLFAPAVAFAEEGWIMRPHVQTMFTMDESPYGRLSYARKLGFTPDGARLYLRADGTPKPIVPRPPDEIHWFG